MLLDLLASALIAITLQPQNIYQAFILQPELRCLLAAFICLVRIVYIWRTPDHSTECQAGCKNQLATRGNGHAPIVAKQLPYDGENNTKPVPGPSPKPILPDIQGAPDSNDTRAISSPLRDHPTALTCIGFAGDSNVLVASVTAHIKDNTPVSSSGCGQATSAKSRTLPSSSAASDPVRLVRSVAPGSSYLGTLETTSTPSVDSTLALEDAADDISGAVVKDVQHPPVTVLSVKNSNITSSTTLSSGSATQAKDAVDPFLTKATEAFQAIYAVPCPPSRPVISLPGFPITIAPSQNKDTQLRHRPSGVSSRPKNQRIAPNDVTSIKPAVGPSSVIHIEETPARALVAPLKVLTGHDPIVKKDVVSISKAECLYVSTPTAYPAPTAATLQPTLSDPMQDSPKASNPIQKSALISLGYGSSGAPRQSSDNAKPWMHQIPTANQDLTATADLPDRSKRIRLAPSRSTFDRALQAIRDASATLGDDLNCRAALSDPTCKRISTSLDDRDIQTCKTTQVTITPRLKGARSAGPLSLLAPDVNKNAIVISEAPTQTLLATVPFVSAFKPETPAIVSSPGIAPSVALDRVDVGNDKNALCSQPPVLLGGCPSTILPINRKPVAPTTSYSHMKDAKHAIKSGTRSSKARTASRKTTSPSSIAINDILSNIVPFPHLQNSLPHGIRQAPDAIDSISHDISAVVNNSTQDSAATPSKFHPSTIPTLDAIMSAPVCTLASVPVEPCVLSSTSPMLVDDPICAPTTLALQNDLLSAADHLHEQVPPLPIFSTSVDTRSASSPFLPSPNSMSVTSPAAAPPPFLIEDHVPMVSSFTFVTDKNVPPVSNTGHEAPPSPFFKRSMEQAPDSQWSFQLPRISSPPNVWNMIDDASITPESNPWHNARSMTSFAFYPVESPPKADPTPVELQQPPFIAQEPRVPLWPYSKFIPLSSSPMSSPSSYRAEDGPTFTVPIPCPARAAASMEPSNQLLRIHEAEMMVVDNPAPTEDSLDNAPTAPAVVEKGQIVPAASEGTGFIPWKAPSLRKRVHFETMDNDTRALPHLDRDDSQRSDPFEERRENKRLKCATCVERGDVYEASSIWCKDKRKENGQRALRRRASKADLAQDWRLRRKPVLLTANGSYTEFCQA